MSTTHAVLGLLSAGGVRHGYELKREHDRRMPGVRPLPFSQLYATLARLLRDGTIAEAAHERAGGPDRVAYRLTEAGRVELAGWLEQVVEPAPFVSAALFTKVFVALLAGPDEGLARRYLAAQRACHLDRMRVLTRAKTDPDAGATQAASLDYLIIHLDGDLRWMANTLKRIEQIRAEVHA
jgi:DNA-binding PadR family transcriptional regulator